MKGDKVKYVLYMKCDSCSEEDVKEPCSAAMTYHYDLFDFVGHDDEGIEELWEHVQEAEGYACLLREPLNDASWKLKLFVRYNDDGTTNQIYPQEDKSRSKA